VAKPTLDLLIAAWIAANEQSSDKVQPLLKKLGMTENLDYYGKFFLRGISRDLGFDFSQVDNGIYRNSKTDTPLTKEQILEEDSRVV
jgi:hypothetical protein